MMTLMKDTLAMTVMMTDDGGDGPAITLRRRAEQKRVHIMGLL